MPVLSCEFFPPKTPESQEKLRGVRAQLAALRPAYYSVTFGAGGSTQQGTLDTALTMREEGFCAAPHISCIGASRANVAKLIATYRAAGIRHLVALRGDLPSGMMHTGDFRHASELVRFIRAEHGDWFHLEVAAYPECHPEARSPGADLAHFVDKVAAGVDGAITQYFFNADAYFAFVDAARTRGVRIPIVPGIMPITQFTQLARFSDSCGAEIPRWLRLRFTELGDDVEAVRALGVQVVSALCQRLLDGGAPGLHFYTLNQSHATLAICQKLGLLTNGSTPSTQPPH